MYRKSVTIIYMDTCHSWTCVKGMQPR